MPKFPKPYFRKQTGQYYVQTRDGKQHPLGKDQEAAYKACYEILGREGVAIPANPSVAARQEAYVAEVVDSFKCHSQASTKPRTHQLHVWMLGVLESAIPPRMLAKDIRPVDVLNAAATKLKWGPSTKSIFIRCVQAAFAYAKEAGQIDTNPLATIRKPTPKPREVVYTEADFARLMEAFPDQNMQDVLITLWHTGCRPHELFTVEAGFVDRKARRWVFPLHSSKGGKKHRVVYLNDAAWQVTERLCDLHPSGPIFRDRAGNPLDRNTISRRFGRKKKSLGKRYNCYSFRHSFAQRKILEGIDPITVGTLMGHSNLSMLANQYSHLAQASDHLARAVQVKGGNEEPGAG